MSNHSLLRDNENESRIPEPALIRGFVVALTSLIAVVLNINIDIAWLDSVLAIYAGIAPLIAGWLIRRKVTPTETAEQRIRVALNTVPPVR